MGVPHDSDLGHKIAVVDEEELANLYAEALDASGFKVTSYSDSIAALVEVSKNHLQYALVISDNRMPGLNGIELISQIHERDSKIQFIVISGFGYISDTDLDYTYLQKPIKISLLPDTVNTIFGDRKKICSAISNARKIKSVVEKSKRKSVN